MWTRLCILFGVTQLVAACNNHCDQYKNEGCDDGQACEAAQGGGDPICATELVVLGRVFDLNSNAGIAGATVVALDANGSAVSYIAVTDSAGNYELQVPTPRNADGSPSTSYEITLRADSSGYVTFPSGIRQALPFSTANPTMRNNRYEIQLPLTDIGLLPLPPGGPATGTIHGNVQGNDNHASVLVVAEVGAKGYTAMAGRDGNYTIFNVPVGTATVAAYAVGYNYERGMSDVIAGESVEVNLDLIDDRASVVSGSVNIVNRQAGEATSVIFVLESTFDTTLLRGVSPPGLRAPEPGMPPNIENTFSVAGVPAGRYVILAAFENDSLVRDESDIGGTAIVHQEIVAGQDVAVADAFKVTGAVDLVRPGANGIEMITGVPTFEWVDDSSEDRYAVTVFDAYGNIIWETGTPKSIVTLPYAGPALSSGMYYQYRVSSIKDPSTVISKSEDLKGVFFLP